MQEFPAFFYHPVHARAGYLFKSQEQLDSAGEGWVDTPAAFGVVTHPPEQVPGVSQPPVVVSPAPVAVETPTETEPPAETAAPFPSAKEVMLMNKPELYALAVDSPEIKEEVPADIETIKKEELLALVLSALPKE